MTLALGVLKKLIESYSSQKSKFDTAKVSWTEDMKLLNAFYTNIFSRVRNDYYILKDNEMEALITIVLKRKEHRQPPTTSKFALDDLDDFASNPSDQYNMYLMNQRKQMKFQEAEPRTADTVFSTLELTLQEYLCLKKVPGFKHSKFQGNESVLPGSFNMHAVHFKHKKKLSYSTDALGTEWCFKNNYIAAVIRETMAGELYRFYIGATQPESRMYFYDNEIEATAASTKIQGFQNQTNTANAIYKAALTCKHTTLAQYASILVSSIFLEENDLKLPNLTLDNQNNLVKFDHDQSFASLDFTEVQEQRFYSERDWPINQNDFLTLPLVSYYHSTQFLDSRIRGNSYNTLSDLLKVFEKEETENPLLSEEQRQANRDYIKLRKSSIILLMTNSPSNSYFNQQKIKAISKILVAHDICQHFMASLQRKIMTNCPNNAQEKTSKAITDIFAFFNYRYNKFKEELFTKNNPISLKVRTYICNKYNISNIAEELYFLKRNKRYKSVFSKSESSNDDENLDFIYKTLKNTADELLMETYNSTSVEF